MDDPAGSSEELGPRPSEDDRTHRPSARGVPVPTLEYMPCPPRSKGSGSSAHRCSFMQVGRASGCRAQIRRVVRRAPATTALQTGASQNPPPWCPG